MNVRFIMRVRSKGMPLPRYTGRLLRRPWSWQDALWLLVVMAVAVSASALFMNTLPRLGVTLPVGVLRFAVVIQNGLLQGLALLLVFHLCKRNRVSLHSALGAPRGVIAKRLYQATRLYLAAMPLVALAALVSHALTASTGTPAQPQPVVLGFIDPTAPLWFRVWLAVTAVIVAPVVEEVVFRGVLFPAMAKKHGIPLAMVVISFLFALVHGHVPAMLPLFVFSAFLASAYLYTGSLLVPIFMHFLFNAVNLMSILTAGLSNLSP